jgi:hypothetical protein
VELDLAGRKHASMQDAREIRADLGHVGTLVETRFGPARLQLSVADLGEHAIERDQSRCVFDPRAANHHRGRVTRKVVPEASLSAITEPPCARTI